jgi:hypothetical protein
MTEVVDVLIARLREIIMDGAGQLAEDALAEIVRLRTENAAICSLISSADYIPIRYRDRPAGFVEMRRTICTTPNLCFEFGDQAPICGPCDMAAVKTLYARHEGEKS